MSEGQTSVEREMGSRLSFPLKILLCRAVRTIGGFMFFVGFFFLV